MGIGPGEKMTEDEKLEDQRIEEMDKLLRSLVKRAKNDGKARTELEEIAVKDSNYTIRAEATGLLGNVGSIHSIPVLLKILNRGQLHERSASIDALRKIGIKVLKTLERNKNKKAKSKIDFALQRVARLILEKSYKKIIKAFKKILRTSEDSQLHIDVVKSIREFGKIRKSKKIIFLLEMAMFHSSNMYARPTATAALGKLKSKESVPVLIIALKRHDDKNVRCWAAKSLAKIGDPKGIPALKWVLKHDIPYVCKVARKALKQLEAKLPKIKRPEQKRKIKTIKLPEKKIKRLKASL